MKLALGSIKGVTGRTNWQDYWLNCYRGLNLISPKILNHPMNYLFCGSITQIRIVMKKVYPILTLLVLLSCSLQSIAQRNDDVIRVRPCDDASIRRQVDSMKVLLEKQGFAILREASIAMESQFEMPVIVPLSQGTVYHFVFIGDVSSSLYEVRMFDYDEKQVFYERKRWGDVEGNIISYSYMPKFSEYHMIKPVQVNKNKKKDLCGYVMLLKKTR
jgi:hypothetical protein